MPYSYYKPVTPKLCVICHFPLANPTRTQQVHQIGPCKTKFDQMQYERDKEKARLRYANRKRRTAPQ